MNDHFKEFDMGKNSKSWAMWVGVLLIITACVFAYITTKPAEANLSFIQEPTLSYGATCA
jgi:uncharacterized integral membrane protein